jgi:ATP/maltotriose-dependent transcriptional regulator MalT
LDSGQPEKAESHALKAISIVPDDLDLVICELLQGAAGYWLAQAYRSLGKLEQACDVLIDVLELMQSSKNYYGAANTISLIASMYQEMGKTNQAISLCQDAIRFNKENHWEEFPPSGLVNIVYADLLIDVGDYQAAQENLEKGRALVESINSIPIKDLVSSVETKVGNTTQLPKEFEIPLTSREVEVLILVAKGHSNREISERLFLSLDTVKGHNRKIYAKLGVKNRTQAVNKATALNIIPQQRI